VQLVGLGFEPVELGLDPPALDFGLVAPGDRSSQRLIVVPNRPVVLTEAFIQGDIAGEFFVEGAECLGTRLDANQGCALTITFAPLDFGERRAELHILDSAEGEHVVPLRGEGGFVLL
jgi:hypothetical protein